MNRAPAKPVQERIDQGAGPQDDLPVSMDSPQGAASFPVTPESDEPASRLRMTTRAVAGYVRGRLGRNRRPGQTEQAERGTHDYEVFWGEKRSIATAQPFSEQVAEAYIQPEERSNVIFADPKTILARSQNHVQRSKDTFTEREGLLDLDDFLLTVAHVGGQHPDAQSREMADNANRMRRGFNFLGQKEYDIACEGIARVWKDYLDTYPDAILNVFNPTITEGMPQRSYHAVLRDINSKFAALIEQQPELASRLRFDPDAWADSEHAKLLVVDDWVTSGATIRNNVAAALHEARTRSLNGLARKAEAHLLIARKDDIDAKWRINLDRDSFTLRSYYEAGRRDFFAPSGSHSSVDYGFEAPLYSMAKYLKQKGIRRELPLLAYIQRRYDKADGTPLTPHEEASQNLLHRISELNGRVWGLTAEGDTLAQRTDPDSLQRIAANRRSVRIANERINALTDEFLDKQGPT